MDDSGNFYIDRSDHMRGYFHSTLMGGYRPIGAGEIWITDGFIVMLNQESGHYAPSGRLDIVADELSSQSFIIFNIDHYSNNKRDNSNIQRVTKQKVRETIIQSRKVAAGLKQQLPPSSWWRLW